MPQAILDYGRLQDLELWSFASAEAQVAAIADDIAYDAHDIDDGLRADLFALDDLAEVAFLRELLLSTIRRRRCGDRAGARRRTSWCAASSPA